MGQRLVIHFLDKLSEESEVKEIANIYYHWGAYTSTAIEEFSRIVDMMMTCAFRKKYLHPYEKVLYLCSCESIGVSEDEINESLDLINKEIPENIPKFKSLPKAVDRNIGILNLTEKSIEHANDWSEGDVTINLNSGECSFNVCCFYTDLNDLKEYYDSNYIKNNIDKTFSHFNINDIITLNIFDKDRVNRFWDFWNYVDEKSYDADYSIYEITDDDGDKVYVSAIE